MVSGNPEGPPDWLSPELQPPYTRPLTYGQRVALIVTPPAEDKGHQFRLFRATGEQEALVKCK